MPCRFVHQAILPGLALAQASRYHCHNLPKILVVLAQHPAASRCMIPSTPEEEIEQHGSYLSGSSAQLRMPCSGGVRTHSSESPNAAHIIGASLTYSWQVSQAGGPPGI